MSIAPGKENYDNWKSIKNKIKHQLSNKTLAKGLKKPGAKTDSQMKTYKAAQEHQEAYKAMMKKRWG